MKSVDKKEIKNGKESQFQRIRSYITVEPVLFAITVPFCLLIICLQNLTLEKVGSNGSIDKFRQQISMGS